jgi:hypothetical protein
MRHSMTHSSPMISLWFMKRLKEIIDEKKIRIQIAQVPRQAK